VNNPRILLCRPQGGLTDILSQIGKCCRYADQHGRMVYVETDFAGNAYFRDEFSQYFMSHDPNLILTSRDIAGRLDVLDVVPAAMKGRIHSYQASYDLQLKGFAEPGGSVVTTFDFDQDHEQPLLLHHAMGGGLRKAEIALRRLSITAMVHSCVEERLARIGEAFTSIHIRHTDYSTDFQDRILKLKDDIVGPIFVATDNRQVLEFCSEIFGSGRVFSFSALPDQAGSPIHSNTKLDARASNLDAISDLLLLARAKKYHYFPIAEGAATFSGFSLLADVLHRNPQLLMQFMQPEAFGNLAQLRLKARKAVYRGLSKGKMFFQPKA
jgi:hypothetical protein